MVEQLQAPQIVTCPVCGSAAESVGEAPGWGEWKRCSECDLNFAHPLKLGVDPKAFFTNAYAGKVKTNSMEEFQERLEKRRVIVDSLDEPDLWFWTPAFEEVLAWLKTRIPPGGTVLEVGCGLGFFLHALRKANFHAVGLDVAEAAVEVNRRDGFDVWHGTIQSLPPDWVKPDAVVSFFVIHHLDDPMAFFAGIHEHAPNAPLAIASYGPKNTFGDAAQPPRTLIRWNAAALDRALRKTGYEPTVRELPSTGVEHGLLAGARTVFARTLEFPRIYRLGKHLESRIVARLPRRAQRGSHVVLALADPV